MAGLLHSRKMTLEDAAGLYDAAGDCIRMDLAQLEQLAIKLNVALAHVVQCLDPRGCGLADRVSICRKGGQFERLRVVGPQRRPAYLYRHVLKTGADRHLMVLRTSPLFSCAEEAELNGGHRVRELVYVLSGLVGVNWAGRSGQRRTDVLATGDSIFIDSWVPHSFYALEIDSQILAIDYA
jgi:hypothetical protein